MHIIQAITKQLVFGDDGVSKIVGSLPANSIITAIKVKVGTAFDGGGTDLVQVGISSDPNRFADAVDVSSTGPATVTELNIGAVEAVSNSTEIIAQYDDSGSDATAGACFVIVEFTQL